MSITQRKWITTMVGLLTPLFFGLFLCGCATGPAGGVAGEKEEAKQPIIEDIRVATSHDGSTVEIVSSMETPHAGIKLMNPPRIYIDLKGAPAAGLSRRMDVNNGLIKRIRVQERQDQKYITRVVVYLSKG
ncbi:MAG: AMIN domain-containing protein, partial [Deltaproteobacteria bacterium]|nr:AMIN domain-containing protein [Deltaproteobacteria bacterium]